MLVSEEGEHKSSSFSLKKEKMWSLHDISEDYKDVYYYSRALYSRRKAALLTPRIIPGFIGVPVSIIMSRIEKKYVPFFYTKSRLFIYNSSRT